MKAGQIVQLSVRDVTIFWNTNCLIYLKTCRCEIVTKKSFIGAAKILKQTYIEAMTNSTHAYVTWRWKCIVQLSEPHIWYIAYTKCTCIMSNNINVTCQCPFDIGICVI